MSNGEDKFDGGGPTLPGTGGDKTDAIGSMPTQDSGETGPIGATGQSTPEGGGGDYEDEIEAALNLVGRVLGEKYRLDRLIGQGGMGAVYEAQHLTIGSKVAIKVLFPERRRQRESLARFQREAQAAGTIGHANIVKVFDLDKTEDGLRYLVMEYVDGESLATIIAKEGVMAPERVVAIAEQVLEALTAAHSQGIVHRDIKPENVMVCADSDDHEVVRVLDFGISKIKPVGTEGHGLTQTGTVLGTPMYMAPEQARGEPDIDLRIDLYAVGVMMYVMLTGQPPFQASNYNALLAKILTDRPPPISEVKPHLDRHIAKVVEKAMASDRELRFASAGEFLEALRGGKVARSLSRRAAAPTGAAKSPLSRGWLWGAVAAAATIFLVIGLFSTGTLSTGGSASESDVTGDDISKIDTSGADPSKNAKVVAASLSEDAGQSDSGGVADDGGVAQEMITVRVSAQPETATIKLGGLIIEGNPAVKQYRRTGEPLAVRVEARGHEPHAEVIRRTEDINLEVTLEPIGEHPGKGRQQTDYKGGTKQGRFKVGTKFID